MSLLSELDLFIEKDKFILANSNEFLELPFEQDSPNFKQIQKYIPSENTLKFTVFGIVGILRCFSGLHVTVITSRRLVGTFGDHKVYSICDVEMLPLDAEKSANLLFSHSPVDGADNIIIPAKPNVSLSEKFNRMIIKTFNQKEKSQELEEKLIYDAKTVLADGNMYFSYTYDLSQSVQRASKMQKVKCFWGNVDRRFWWNEFLQFDMIALKLNGWILPIIQGFVDIIQSRIDGRDLTFVLISRRSRERAGLRYQRRGLNERGDVANYVETEQIVSYENHTVSLVQIRGSIPMYWCQASNLFRPDPIILGTPEDNLKVLKLHFDKQKIFFKNHFLLNLVDQKGREFEIGSQYKNLVEKLEDPQVR
jgi:hypothetical protein